MAVLNKTWDVSMTVFISQPLVIITGSNAVEDVITMAQIADTFFYHNVLYLVTVRKLDMI